MDLKFSTAKWRPSSPLTVNLGYGGPCTECGKDFFSHTTIHICAVDSIDYCDYAEPTEDCMTDKFYWSPLQMHSDSVMTQLHQQPVEPMLGYSPPIKRRRIDGAPDKISCVLESSKLVQCHPLGVRPLGNALTTEANLKAASGLFAWLPDEVLCCLLEYLQPSDLLRVGGSCRALHAFTRNEELWRSLFVESSPSPESFMWRGTWRSTYLGQTADREPTIDCSNLFSDVLHRPFLCAHIPLQSFAQNIPQFNEITRLNDLSTEEFQSTWVDRPFILVDPVKEWPLYGSWSTERLLARFSDVCFRAEAVDWPLKTYIEYMNNNHDESPLYLFDRSFAEKMNLTVSINPDKSADYWPPTCFGSDLFSVLGEQRPDHRWLIIGPERSGSTFHKDPNATSAWNAVLKGRKYWILFPSSQSLPPPPGVYVSEDQSEVTSPLSIAEWLLGFHAEARQTPGCVEGICNEGEVLHVPSGWFHLVLNLEPSIAITQNFVPRGKLGAVLHFLRDQKQSISGFSDAVEDPYGLFVDRLKAHDSELLQEGFNQLEKGWKGGRWEELTKLDDEYEGGFSFCFGGDDDDDDIER